MRFQVVGQLLGQDPIAEVFDTHDEAERAARSLRARAVLQGLPWGLEPHVLTLDDRAALERKRRKLGADLIAIGQSVFADRDLSSVILGLLDRVRPELETCYRALDELGAAERGGLGA